MESFNVKKNYLQESTNYSIKVIKFLDPNIKLLDCETDGLLDFEIQTTLESFIK